jgi:midasin
MNPGGDFGKRELSPALRNRFTEIWVEAITGKQYLSSNESKNDVLQMLMQLLQTVTDN